MNHLVISILFTLLGAVLGGVLLDSGGGALLGAALGLLAGAQVRLGDRMRRIEARLAQPAGEAAAPAWPAQARAPGISPGGDPPASITTPARDSARVAAPEVPAVPARPSTLERAMLWLKAYATTGNVVAKVGVLLLFFGVSFLLKYAIDRNALPIELRLAATAAAAIGLIVAGWRLRGSRSGFGRILQGGGVGLLYLTVFAAARLYQVLPMGFAFVLLVALVALSSLLAVLQDARALAVLGTVGGFLAPVLTSTGGGSHVALFGYYALLNAGIVGIAWFRAWRVLNLTGFVFTFAIGAAWGQRFYQPEFFATTEPFLVLSFLFYLAVAVLFALRHPPRLKGYVDGTLVFGLPLVVFGLQAQLVRDIEFGRAWSAFGMGLIYVGVAALLRRRAIAQLGMLIEALLALGIVALSLAIPFAFDGHLTATAWALEGAGLVWIGVRQQRLRARVCGVLLQLAAGTAYFALQSSQLDNGMAVLNAQYLGSVFIAAGALFASRMLDQHRDCLRGWELPVRVLLLGWGLLWWYIAGMHEIAFHIDTDYELAALLGFFGASGVALGWGARRIGWSQAAYASWLHAPLGLLLALIAHAGDPGTRGPLLQGRAAGWTAFIAAAWYLAHLGDKAWSPRLQHANHTLSLWLSLYLLAWSAAWSLADIGGTAGTWRLAAWGAMAIATLVLLPLHGHRLAWPFAHFDELYCGNALLPVAGFALAWVAVASAHPGAAQPLPFLPLANPFDLVSAGSLLAVLLWWRQARAIDTLRGRALLERTMLPLVGALGFLWLNVAVARAVHAFAGVDYAPYALHRSPVYQGSISVLWGITALAVMVVATQRGVRRAWMAGAVLLAALVLKLFLVDLGDRGTVARIVSFLAAGGLMVLIGFLSPAPPRRLEETQS